ncbi:uncharacterized protein I303_106647 [Kwoniella dejecticola CBS 10117]|uniref:Uncharacterized protein n=1 Tax=Kwoniella dejecticola CBS 10117 TaxID=1296121 RepID=A0A1A5ZU34_9TREE|nr:uncharacterized protein I303_08710 [Kwoniella dejecticola CBS 10117]OBR81323.1 hypothetical protein I303_08710 [Kwoniella dejecticola CBS 10117]
MSDQDELADESLENLPDDGSKRGTAKSREGEGSSLGPILSSGVNAKISRGSTSQGDAESPDPPPTASQPPSPSTFESGYWVDKHLFDIQVTLEQARMQRFAGNIIRAIDSPRTGPETLLDERKRFEEDASEMIQENESDLRSMIKTFVLKRGDFMDELPGDAFPGTFSWDEKRKNGAIKLLENQLTTEKEQLTRVRKQLRDANMARANDQKQIKCLQEALERSKETKPQISSTEDTIRSRQSDALRTRISQLQDRNEMLENLHQSDRETIKALERQLEQVRDTSSLKSGTSASASSSTKRKSSVSYDDRGTTSRRRLSSPIVVKDESDEESN